MILRDRINDEMKAAMKARDAARTAALRLIRASIQEKENALKAGAPPLTDDDVVAVLSRMLKQREESASIYAQAGRTDLESTERAEIAVIREFMPKQMSDDEARAAVAAVVSELGASSMKDMGRVMAALKERHAGAMDFARAGAVVKEMLSKPA
jgi:uncharacterized protein YqeY